MLSLIPVPCKILSLGVCFIKNIEKICLRFRKLKFEMGQHPKIQHFLIQSIIKIKYYRIIHILSNKSQRIFLILIFIWNHICKLKKYISNVNLMTIFKC